MKLRVILATTNPAVYQVLRGLPCEIREAVTTHGVYQALDGKVNLAIVDLDSLLEDQLPRATLFDILNRARIPWTTPETFLGNPQVWLAHARTAAGDLKSFPPATVAITSFSGGVGKTTLTLDTAVAFAQRTHLPVAVVEFPHGPSALRVLTGLDTEEEDFVSIGHSDMDYPQWRNCSVITVDYHLVGPVLKPEEVQARFDKIRQAHILTLLDTEYPHPWLNLVTHQVDQVLIIAAPRADTWHNAVVLHRLMQDENKSAKIIFNMVDGWRDRLVQTGLARALDLPRVRDPERLEGRLGTSILRLIYPYWQ